MVFDCTRARNLTYWFPANDLVVGRGLRDAGEFARPESDLIRACLGDASGKWVIDVGANIGAIGIRVAATAKGVQVLCLEPHLPSYQLLCTNAVVNNRDNVHPRPWAVGASDRTVEFPLVPLGMPQNHGGIKIGMEAPQQVPTLMVTIDGIAPAGLGFVKIDTEGHDLEVLRGGMETWRTQKPYILFEAIYHDIAAAGIDLVRSIGYRCFWFFAPWQTPTNEKGAPVDIVQWLGDANVLAIPPGKECPWNLPEVGEATEDWRSKGPLCIRALEGYKFPGT